MVAFQQEFNPTYFMSSQKSNVHNISVKEIVKKAIDKKYG